MKKINRLKKNREIASIVKKRKRITNSFYTIYFQETTEETFKVAVSVSKKYGNAVERNYAKRVVREIIHKNMEQIKKFYIVVVVKSQAKDEKFTTLSDTLSKSLQLLDKKYRRN